MRETAGIGLYGHDILMTLLEDATGQGFPILAEELFWGDAGIALSIMGSTLAAVGIIASAPPSRSRTGCRSVMAPTRTSRWARSVRQSQKAGSDVANMLTTAKYDEAPDEWMISGQKAWVTNGGVADVLVGQAVVEPGLGARGQAAFVMSADTAGIAAPRSCASTVCVPQTPRTYSSTASGFQAVPCSAAKTSSTRSSLHANVDVPAGGDGDL